MGLAKIAESASHRHAEISPVKDTHLMNNKLPPAEILCGEWKNPCPPFWTAGEKWSPRMRERNRNSSFGKMYFKFFS